MATLQGLLRRVLIADGPNYELEEQIAIHVAKLPATVTVGHEILGNERVVPVRVPTYTASLDAALGLMERVLPGVWYVLARGRIGPDEPLYGARLIKAGSEDGAILAEAEHDTSQALALLAAVLIALSEKEA
jgi:hypothetical protein